MMIEVTAPTRIDLAGGTLDIYPLYLFLEGSLTVNAAIDLYSLVKIAKRRDKGIHIYSEDLGKEVKARDIESLKYGTDLDYLIRIIKFFAPPDTGLNITTECQAPRGSGIGGSSSLALALSAGLNRLGKKRYSLEELIDIDTDLEVQSIGTPTGNQDYYAACYGGVNAIWYGVEKDRIEPLLKERMIERLEEHLILTFTGKSRRSSLTNWQAVRGYIDGKRGIVDRMKRIREAAIDMRRAILKGDFKRAADALDEEWEARKGLAEGMVTPRIRRIMSAAKVSGAWASKISGAGGGGSIVTFVKPERRERVIKAIEKVGGKILDFKIAKKGLEISEL